MRSFLIVLILLLTTQAFSQIALTDSFADGNFDQNPTWIGDTSKFDIASGNVLQLNDTGATGNSETYISTVCDAIYKAQWDFWVEMDFGPSSSNQTFVYLVSSQSDLTGSLDGYYVRIGNTTDEVSLYRQTGSSSSEIIDGTDDRVDLNNVKIRVRVTRDSIGNWELFSDTSSLGGNYISEGTTQDTIHTQTGYFGFLADYTSSRKDKFFFDDISVTGSKLPDLSIPRLDTLIINSSSQIELRFSEALSTSGVDQLAYQFDQLSLVSLQFIGADSSKVLADFNPAMTSGSTYTYRFLNVRDKASNLVDTSTRAFLYFESVPPAVGDVIINEIMADPAPPVALPDAEFLELYNRSSKTFNLQDWQLNDGGSSPAVLPAYLLSPDSYVLVTRSSNVNLFGTANIIAAEIPALNNSGDDLTLTSPTGLIVDDVNYRQSWYADDDKDNGGFTLERVNPNHPCGGKANWKASEDLDGGTPRKQNSIFDTAPDIKAPTIVSAVPFGLDTLQFEFSEGLDSTSILAGQFMFSPALTSSTLLWENNTYSSITAILNSSINPSILYKVTALGFSDCFGNTVTDDSLAFGIGRAPEAFEVRITELFPDPDESSLLPEGEFVELYNRTDDLINLDDLSISDPSTSSSLFGLFIKPKEYLILTESSDLSRYSSYGRAVPVSLPSLNNSSDEISLVSRLGKVIDQVNYSDTWYQDSEKAKGGWTLELINPSDLCGQKENWRASAANGMGTPGQQNSIADLGSSNRTLGIGGISATATNELVIAFNQSLDPSTLSITSISSQPNISVDSIFLIDGSTASLLLSESIGRGIDYKIAFNNLSNCAGTTNTEVVGGLYLANVGDVIINEILFDPTTTGSDFVELYNASDISINLQNWNWEYQDSKDSTRYNPLIEEPLALEPNAYALFTEDGTAVLGDYPLSVSDVFYTTDLPTLPNDAGDVHLVDQLKFDIDRVQYSDDWHFDLINNDDGVSLERINPLEPSQDEKNWHSASEEVGFATPGYQNSQYLSSSANNGVNVSLRSKTVSPDNDGFEDILTIDYNFDLSGFVANVKIYDLNGRLIRTLTKSQLLSISGSINWDGLDNNGEKARIGMHIIYFEVFDLSGNVEQYKLACAVAGRL